MISYLFTLFAGLFLFGVGFIGWTTGQEIHFELVPGVEPESMGVTLMSVGAFALLSLILTPRRGALGRRMLFAWNLLVFALLLCALTPAVLPLRGHGTLPAGRASLCGLAGGAGG